MNSEQLHDRKTGKVHQSQFTEKSQVEMQMLNFSIAIFLSNYFS